jgi:hypothetical protein
VSSSFDAPLAFNDVEPLSQLVVTTDNVADDGELAEAAEKRKEQAWPTLHEFVHLKARMNTD